jgi:hypothetical protein
VINKWFERFRVPGKWFGIGLVVAVILVGAGFSKGYLVSGSTAREMATQKAQDAIAAAETPICVVQALKDPQVKTRMGALDKFHAEYDYDNLGKTLDKFGWSTMPGSKTATDAIADDCYTTVQEALEKEAKPLKPQAMK